MSDLPVAAPAYHAGAAGAYLERERSGAVVAAVGDRDAHRLEQVIVNLLANAHRHTPPGTRVSITGRRGDHDVTLTVSDNGPSIPSEEHEPIFRRFYRLNPAGGGSGIGLEIARMIVELHGGRLCLESAPGRGAAFRVVLPRRNDGEQGSP